MNSSLCAIKASTFENLGIWVNSFTSLEQEVTITNNNKEIYIVVLGSDSQYNRFQEVKALTTWTFNNYIWP